MEATLKVTSGTKYHDQTDSLVDQAPTNTREDQSRLQLIHTRESNLSNQGIDVSYPPGAINAKFVVNLKTPSGIKPVILLTDKMIDLDKQYDFLPGCPLPEQGNVWSTKFNSVSQNGNPTISKAPEFSQRTEHYLNPFLNFNSHVIVRLICKPAMTQSQMLWVSRSDRVLDFSTEQHLNEIGFSWVPSKANEIFVLMPWYYNDYVASTQGSYESIFGCINVRNLSPVVSATGNDLPLVVTYYFCPHQLYTYVPIPVSTVPPQIYYGSLNCNLTGILTTSGTLGTITCPNDMTISLGAIRLAQVSTFWGFNCFIDGAEVGALATDPTIAAFRSTILPLTEGDHVFTYTANFDLTLGDVGPLLNWHSLIDEPPTFTPFALQSGGELQIKEIEEPHYQNYFNPNVLPPKLFRDPSIENVISQISNGFINVGYKAIFSTSVISQTPDVVESTLSHGSETIFRVYDTSKRKGKELGFNLIRDYYTRGQSSTDSLGDILEDYIDFIDEGQEQIFEYQYNPKSAQAAKTYGKMNDHNIREDRHDMYLQTLSLTSTNKFTPFNVSVNLSTVAAAYPYVNTREYHRHLIKSNMPIIKIRANKTPFSNVVCRVVQGTFTEFEDIMQMPGQEWDPTLEDLHFQPYWNYVTPGVLDISIPLTITTLGGQIDISGMQLVIFFNTSPIEYHHKIDYDPDPVTPPFQNERTTTVTPAHTSSIVRALGVRDGIIPSLSNLPDVAEAARDIINAPDLPSAIDVGRNLVAPLLPDLPSTPDIVNTLGTIRDVVTAPDITSALAAGNGLLNTIPAAAGVGFNPTPPRHIELRRRRGRANSPIDEGVLQIGEELKSERKETNSIAERSPNTLEGVQMETNRIHYDTENDKTQIEKAYHLVGAITTSLNSTLKFIAIPINHSAFGKMEVTSAKKYKFWQGEPSFKITTAVSSVLSSIPYVAQVPSDFDFTNNKALSALQMYPRVQTVAWNNSCELACKWFNPTPRLPVQYETTATGAQLGYLVIAFPTLSGATFGGGDQNIKITIHCNTSNITYSLPSQRYPDYSYPGLLFTRYGA